MAEQETPSGIITDISDFRQEEPAPEETEPDAAAEPSITLTITVRQSENEVFGFELATSLGDDVPVPMQVLEAAGALIQRQVEIGRQLIALDRFNEIMMARMQQAQEEAFRQQQAQANRNAVVNALALPSRQQPLPPNLKLRS